MNKLPGFTAEASLYKSKMFYLVEGAKNQPSIVPQRISSDLRQGLFAPDLFLPTWPWGVGDCIPNCFCVQDTPENPCPCCGYFWGDLSRLLRGSGRLPWF
jgi:hypothetical protein